MEGLFPPLILRYFPFSQSRICRNRRKRREREKRLRIGIVKSFQAPGVFSLLFFKYPTLTLEKKNIVHTVPRLIIILSFTAEGIFPFLYFLRRISLTPDYQLLHSFKTSFDGVVAPGFLISWEICLLCGLKKVSADCQEEKGVEKKEIPWRICGIAASNQGEYLLSQQSCRQRVEKQPEAARNLPFFSSSFPSKTGGLEGREKVNPKFRSTLASLLLFSQ